MIPYGQLADGRCIDLHRIKTDQIAVEVTTLGAAWRGIWLADDPHNWVLGHPSAEAQARDTFYRGAIVGRVAGRLPENCDFRPLGTFRLDCQTPGVCLHGGPGGTAGRVWQVLAADNSQIVLMDRLEPGHMGFPGAVEITATYRVEATTLTLTLDTTALTEAAANIAPHPYFSLGNDLDTVILTMDPNKVQMTDDQQLPTGALQPVTAPWDFGHGKALRGHHIDHKFVFENEVRARLHCPSSARTVDVYSKMPAAQVFTGRDLPSVNRGLCSGLAIEPQFGLPGTLGEAESYRVLRAGETTVNETQFTFSRGTQ